MTAAVSKPPRGLAAQGRALWRAVLADVPEDCDLDARELALLAEAARVADHLADLEKVIERDGVMTVGSKGQTVVHPAVAEARQQRLALLRLLGAIGLDDPLAEALSPTQLRASRAARARWSRQDELQARRARRTA